MGMTKSNINVWETYYSKKKSHPVWPSQEIIEFYMYYLKKEKLSNVLDVGCGLGRNLWFFGTENFKLYGIDSSKEAVNFARHHLAEEGLSAKLKVSESTNIPFKDNYFDLVLATGLFHYLSKDDAETTRKEILRVMKPNAWIISNLRSIHDSYYKQDRRIDERTCISSKPSREGVILRYYSQNEAKEFFRDFSHIMIGSLDTWHIGKTKKQSHWLVAGRKPVNKESIFSL